MTNNKKHYSKVILALLGVLVFSAVTLCAASAEKQLAQGIRLYNQNKPTEALDYFIDVMVNGNAEQVAQANKYVNAIHNSMGGIQTPVEVDVNFQEGAVRNLNDEAQAAIQQQQEALEQAQAEVQETVDTQLQSAQAELDALNAQQMALTQQIEANRLAAQQQAEQAAATAAQNASQLQEAAIEQATVAAGVAGVLPATAEADEEAIDRQTEEELEAAQQTEEELAAAPHTEDMMTTVGGSSTFADLTSPDAIEARNLYTEQKLDSMLQAALDKIKDEKGVHLYMRDGRPDAIDIDDGVLFNKTEFRSEATPLLNNIYEVLALTQGAQYVILPAGSYTDDVTLAGMREAAALNAYLVKRGISQGKLSYNMGLVEKEAPAQFANLKGLSLVFDYSGKFPTRMEQNENDETNPLLSMAIVPQCHAIDRSLGEAYAIDFSVLETTQGIDNWVLQVVQHGRDGNYYIVRQLEGFAPVYHQILWNGRKGIIGPELPCGKYTIVLTATDLKGNKQTLRRRVVVKCSSSQSDSIAASCGVKEPEKPKATAALNYKAARLWKKPAREMRSKKPTTDTAAATTASSEAQTATDSASYTVTKTVTNIVTEDTPAPVSTTTTTVSESDAYYGDLPANNPYDMPYDEIN